MKINLREVRPLIVKGNKEGDRTQHRASLYSWSKEEHLETPEVQHKVKINGSGLYQDQKFLTKLTGRWQNGIYISNIQETPANRYIRKTD